ITLYSFLYGLIISVVLFSQIDFFKSWLNTQNEAALHAFIWGLLLIQIIGMAGVFLQGMQVFGLLALSALLTPLLRLFLGDLFLKAGWGAASGVWATNLQNLVVFFAAIWFMARQNLFRALPVTGKDGGWRPSDLWVPAISVAVLSVLLNTDFVLVRHYFSPAEADRFATAALFGHSMIFFLQPISSVLLPKVVDHFEGWEKAETAIARKALALSFGLAVAMAGVGTLLAEPVLTLFAGHADPE